jgi:hypothetical protein
MQQKAFELWSYAAQKGQIDAQLRISQMNARGVYVIRDPKLSIELVITFFEINEYQKIKLYVKIFKMGPICR